MFYTYATVSNILLQRDWSYPACEQHNKIVSHIVSKFYCKECKSEPQKTALRYRLELEVRDATGQAIFTIFDKDARKLLHIRANELALQYPAGIDAANMPDQLKSILGVDFLFCIKVSDYNFRSPKTTFTVVKTFLYDEIPTHEVEAASPSLAPPEPSAAPSPSHTTQENATQQMNYHLRTTPLIFPTH